MESDYSLQTYFTLEGASLRGMKMLPEGHLLVVKADNKNGEADSDPDISGVEVLYDSDFDGISSESVEIIKPGFRLSHGIEYVAPENSWGDDMKGRILASSDSEVWAWPYNEGDKEVGTPQVMIENINAADPPDTTQGHWTRTLRLSPDQRYLFVSVGSINNVDPNSFRARVRKFDLQSSEFMDNLPYDFTNGEVFANGLRNTVGTAFDQNGVLWGTDVGADNLNRADLGGDIHEYNPGEELNMLGDGNGEGGNFYGYPYCWSEGYLPPGVGMGNGTIWAWPDSNSTDMDEIDDDWCRQNSLKSQLVMQAHSTPLGLVFNDVYQIVTPTSTLKCPAGVRFPRSSEGDAFVALHGSWNSPNPVGYEVVHIPFTIPGGLPTGEVFDLMKYKGPGAVWPSDVRPVDVTFDICGRLLVTDDGGGRIFTISYRYPDDADDDDGLRPIWYILIGYNALAMLACFIAIVYAQIKANREPL
eukprot:CAMPEP_0201521876 /NCGR_PEP_ID=MMETSP0161_2-20130828/16326_1 /ASSEMBLY_ACC=CAM_ASM_000251 /TAXON_ID=180227 /ORGANISM="Neoparamoeba aestuarina, Strain SoJaBio B1-5/56/2" /LENGTH=472 /DNA_ID=CAMNT_0047920601 /DNA_START=87 /DNA_END=1505 /DNA_ORIENTATION=+